MILVFQNMILIFKSQRRYIFSVTNFRIKLFDNLKIGSKSIKPHKMEAFYPFSLNLVREINLPAFYYRILHVPQS
jgi:hypothetical protein